MCIIYKNYITGGLSMKQKSKTIFFSLLVVIAVFCILFSLSVSYRLSKKTSYNVGAVSGNTAGNLYNKGIFCEYKGKVFFSNSYDRGELYIMDSDGSHISKLYNDTVSYINAAGKYIYYARNNLNESNINAIFRGNLFGVYRIDQTGKNLLSLSNETCGAVSLGNNQVFFQQYSAETALTLKSISIDGITKKNLEEAAINPSCIVNGTMYYNNVADNYNLMEMNIETGSTTLVNEGGFWNPIYDDNYIYFMDIENNYTLARMNLNNYEKQTLTAERIDAYNLYDEYIYYQVNDPSDPRLCRIKKDGTEVESILSGNFCNINVTSEYVYFNRFGYDTPIFRIKTSGPIEVSRFDEAADAIKRK